MPRYPYAAEVFEAEVKALYPKASMEPFGDPDGLGVQREFRLDKTTSAKLVEAVEFLNDPRVHSVNLTDAGYLHLEFSPLSPQADSREPFMLKLATDVLEERSSEPSVVDADT